MAKLKKRQKEEAIDPELKQKILDEEKNVNDDSATEKKSKKGKRKPRKGLGQELIDVYEATGDDLTAVTMLEHRRRSWQRMLLAILVFLVFVFIGVGIVSWLIWGGNQSFSGENVVFDLEAPKELTSGQEVTYLVSFANREDTAFRKAEVELRYPPGFIFTSSDPAPSTGENLWDLGSLNSGFDGEIEVSGRLVGKPDIDTTISGVLRYWPANFSSEFQEVASAQSLIKPVNAMFRVEGPDQVLVGQSASYSINVKNESDDLIQDLQIEGIYPSDFVLESSTPELEEGVTTWLIEAIAPGEEQEIVLDGFFSAIDDPEVEMLFLLSQKGADDDFFMQKEERVETILVEGDLIVNLIANGSTKNTTTSWGDVINLSINYQNNSETELADLTVVGTLETRYRINEGEKSSGGAIDFSTLVDANRGSVEQVDKVTDQSVHVRTITWDGNDLDTLETLDADEEGTINLQFALITAEDAKESINHPGDVEVVFVADVKVGKTGGVEEEITVTSNPITIKLDTDLELDAHARYYDENEEQLGSGPLPPEVGEKTTYRVIWDLTNSIHEAQDIIISTQLPSNVAWVNQYNVSAGEVEFNSGGNDLTWRLNKLPSDIEEVTLAFDIELSPLDTQVDKVANLTKKITMTAKDAITGGNLIQSISPLTTGVDRDELASDKGLVVN